MTSTPNVNEDDLRISLLLSKLKLIKKNYDSSIVRRKSRIIERENDIKLYNEKMHTPRNIAKNMKKSQSERIMTPNNSMYNYEPKKSIFKNNSYNSNNKIGKKKVEYLNKTSPKFIFNSPRLSKKCILIDTKTGKGSLGSSLKKSNSSIDVVNKNNNSNINFKNGYRSQQMSLNKLINSNDKKLKENVYKFSELFEKNLKKIKKQKEQIDLKNYHKYLINLGMMTFSKDSVNNLDKTFTKMRKDSKTNIHNNRIFIKRIERKEEKIIKKINKNNEKAKSILNLLKIKNRDCDMRKIIFEKVVH